MDDKFNGGGTPISSIINTNVPQQIYQEQQPQRQEYQQPQEQYAYQQPQIQEYQQPQEQYVHQQPQKRIIPQPKQQINHETKPKTNWFTENIGLSPILFTVLVILIIILNNNALVEIEKNILPISLRIGNPPFIIIIINALVIALLFSLINKYLI